MKAIKNNKEYILWVKELKRLIVGSQIKASISVNRELLALYWRIGKSISEKTGKMNWGVLRC